MPLPHPRLTRHRAWTAVLAVLATVALSSCAVPTPTQATSRNGADAMANTPSSPAPSLPAGFHQPVAGLLTGGQPTAGDWRGFAASGVRSVINLRPDAETPDRNEADEVALAGMEYRQIPVAGGADITFDNAKKLRSALDALPSPVLVHCASGNRVGALLALDAVQSKGMTVEQALELGRKAGLTSAEGRVREVLGADPAP